MSKSLGNVIDPWEILDTRGADAAALVDVLARARRGRRPGSSFEAIDAAMRDTLLTLWNTCRFFTTYASLNGFDPADPGRPRAGRAAGSLDRWILSRLATRPSAG